MRTTLTLDEDVVLVARRVARERNVSLGTAISELARRGASAPHNPTQGTPTRGRFALLPVRNELVTPEYVDELIEREGI